MKPILLLGTCIVGLLCIGTRPEAHHAFAAEFDVNRVIKLEGTVVKMEWVNPHAWLTISVPNQEGKPEEWALEFGPPNTMFRSGFRRSTFFPDMTVKVIGFGASDGQRILNVATVTLPDGKTLKGESASRIETPAEQPGTATPPANQGQPVPQR